jgi:hypothetical protein
MVQIKLVSLILTAAAAAIVALPVPSDPRRHSINLSDMLINQPVSSPQDMPTVVHMAIPPGTGHLYHVKDSPNGVTIRNNSPGAELHLVVHPSQYPHNIKIRNSHGSQTTIFVPHLSYGRIRGSIRADNSTSYSIP